VPLSSSHSLLWRPPTRLARTLWTRARYRILELRVCPRFPWRSSLPWLCCVTWTVQLGAQITVGGLSAGAFFAVQYHVAYSSKISGAAILAGGPYYCAQGQQTTGSFVPFPLFLFPRRWSHPCCYAALTTCMTPVLGGPSPQELADLTNLFASTGSIDSTSHLANAKVYIYSGLLDSVVSHSVVQALQQYYQIFVTAGNVTTGRSMTTWLL
jgi:hypothetical protein